RTGLAALQLAPILVSVVWQASWVGLLLLPAIVWHVQGDQYRSRTCRRLIGGCVLLVFVFGYVALTYGGVAWIGPLVALWLLGEDLTAIYRMASDSRYFWLYPPYCIYLAAPLGVLPEWYAYALCVLVEVAAVGGALAVLRAAVPGRGADHTNAAIAVLASMPFNTAIVIGQISGVLSLILAASLWAWRRRRPVTTGLLLSLLFIKPNLAIFSPPVCLLARQWRVL